MAVSGLLGRSVDEGDWTQQMQRRRPAQNPADTMIVLPPDTGTLYYTPEDISPQWDQDMTKVARALRARGAI